MLQQQTIKLIGVNKARPRSLQALHVRLITALLASLLLCQCCSKQGKFVLCSAAVRSDSVAMPTGQGRRLLQALPRALALAAALGAFAASNAALATPALPGGTPVLAFAGLLRLRLPRGPMRGGPLAAEGGSGSGGSGSGAGGSGDSGLLAAVRYTAVVAPPWNVFARKAGKCDRTGILSSSPCGAGKHN